MALLAPVLAALLLVPPAARRRGWPAATVCILGSVVSFAAAIALLADRLNDPAAQTLAIPWLRSGSSVIAEVGVHVDGIAASMLAVVTLVALCVQVFSLGYMHDEAPPRSGATSPTTRSSSSA